MVTATPPNPGQKNDETADVPAHPAEAPAPVADTNAAVALSNTAVPGMVDPDDLVDTAKTPTLMDRVQAFRSRYEKEEMALFFFGGFVYDILTLSRIDDTFSLVQQFVYLGVLAALLLLEQRFPDGAEPPRYLAKVWRWREDAVHFFFGSLLSSFTLFLFKSASGLTAFLFMVGMFALLAVNELPRFRQLGPIIRVVLFSLCVTLYFAYLLPMLFGRMGWWTFLLAVLVGCGSVYGLMRVIGRWRPDVEFLVRNVAGPGFGTQGALLALYLVGVIPPVPLAVQYSGIYHDVKRVSAGVYHLSYEEQPWWKVWTAWHRGDQNFLLRPGDQPVYFFRIFAPANFAPYRVRVRWYYDHPDKGWTALGNGWVTTVSSNGTEGGYRSLAKPGTTPKPGDWRVVLETEDGHEINRMSFTVEPDTRTEPRQFAVEVSTLKVIEPISLEDWQKTQKPASKPGETAVPPAATATPGAP